MSLSTETPRAPRHWRRTAMAGVLLAGTALGGLAVGHAGFAASETTPGAPVNPPGSGMTAHAAGLHRPGHAGEACRRLDHHQAASRCVRR